MGRRTDKTARGAAGGQVTGWLPALLLFVLVVVAYIPALRGGFVWDDPRYVTENETLRSAEGLGRIWTDPGATIQYYPMTFTSFWVEHHLWGANPLGYHLVNVILHGLSAILLWLILKRLSLPGAWLAAALFALHPVQVESVAWITERKNVLSGFFYMAAMLAYIRFAPPDERSPDRGDRRFYFAALFLFLLALFSKTVTSSLPAAILLMLWWKRGKIALRDALPLAPFFAAGIAMGSVTSWMEANNVHAAGPEWEIPFVERLLIAGRALWFYLGKLLFPVRLAFNYPRWSVDAGVWWQWLFPAAAIASAAILSVRRRTIGRGPLASALLFGGTLLPALGFINIYPMRYSFVADHFQYLASIAFFVVVAVIVTRLFGAGRTAVKKRRAVAVPPSTNYAFRVTAAILVVILGTLTWKQSAVYEDLETLWRDTLEKNPASFLAHNNLASIIQERGAADDAIRHWSDAVRLKPDFYEARCSLGKALVRRGQVADGKAQLMEAKKIRPEKVWAHIFLGDALAAEGSVDDAVECYQTAVSIDPDEPGAHTHFANTLARSGRLEEAVERYRIAVDLDRSSPVTRNNMANALSELGRFAEAAEQYAEALRLEPGYSTARRNLGLALSNQGKKEEAIRVYREAIRIIPGDIGSRLGLAALLVEEGRGEEAAVEYREILRIDPRCEPARTALDSLP